MSPSKEEVIKKQILVKHARNFGYFLIPSNELFQRKYDYFFKVNQKFRQDLQTIEMQINNISTKICELKSAASQIMDISEKIKLNDLQSEFEKLLSQKVKLSQN